MCVLVGVGVALLEEVHHSESELWGPMLRLHPVWKSQSSPLDQDVKFSAPSPAPSLPAQCHASHHDDTVR